MMAENDLLRRYLLIRLIVCASVFFSFQVFAIGNSGLLKLIPSLPSEQTGFAIHRVHYDDGIVSEDLSLNVSVAKPELAKGFINGISNTMKRIGKSLHLISHKNSTDGLDTNQTFFSGAVDNFKKHLSVIFPGTQWCGDGDRAKSYDDLGTFEKTDRCCRAHDKCPVSIGPKVKSNGLENTGLFTRSHCDCDDEFYSCLKKSQTLVSKKIGFTYFTVLGPQCFREEFPVIGCSQYTKGKCVKYHLDELGSKKYQWFDSPPF